MHAAWIVLQREINHYFASPLAYLIAFAFLLLTGLIFNADLTFAITVRPVDPALIPDFLSFILVLIAPLLTMRLLSEESREGTLELLLTAPIPDYALVMGKFLSAWLYLSFLLAMTFVYQIILLMISFPDMSHTISAYLGIWLYGGAALAVGLMFSAMTSSQILAAFLSTVALLMLYLGDIAGQIVPNMQAASVIRSLSLQGHFSTSFVVGLMRAEDVVYFAGLIVLALHVTIKLVEYRRWR